MRAACQLCGVLAWKPATIFQEQHLRRQVQVFAGGYYHPTTWYYCCEHCGSFALKAQVDRVADSVPIPHDLNSSFALSLTGE